MGPFCCLKGRRVANHRVGLARVRRSIHQYVTVFSLAHEAPRHLSNIALLESRDLIAGSIQDVFKLIKFVTIVEMRIRSQAQDLLVLSVGSAFPCRRVNHLHLLGREHLKNWLLIFLALKQWPDPGSHLDELGLYVVAAVICVYFCALLIL